MKKKILCLLVAMLCICIVTEMTNAGREVVTIDINSLDLTAHKEQWERENKVSIQSEGINITIENKFTKVLLSFKETLGRDVELVFTVPKEYMSPSVLGNVNSDDNTTITWRLVDNATIITMYLSAFQETTLTLSKGDLIYGQVKKGVHDFWNYVEYDGDSTGVEENIVIFISKDEPGFAIDNKHMIVQYKTNFFGWYYPIDDTSSDKVYYYVNDMGDKYRVVTHFKRNMSGDVKIQVFPGASEGLNWDSVKGALANTWVSTMSGIKKFIIDFFGDDTPNHS